MVRIASVLLIVISAICMFLSAAPFTPALFVSLFLMCVAGIFGALGFFQISLLLFFTTLAVVASPVMNIGTINLWPILVPYVIGFGGMVWGVSKKV